MSKNDPEDDFPTAEQFFVDEPLYRAVALPPGRFATAVFQVEFYTGSLKTYCTQCEEDSIFRTDRVQSGELTRPHRRPHAACFPNPEVTRWRTRADEFDETSSSCEYAEEERSFTVEFYCTREHRHRIYFCFAVRDKTLQKVGQFPSLSDLQGATFERYRRLLPKPLASAYTRAINLHAHDVGAGSLVYLRRILEALLEEAHDWAKADNGWDEDTYRRMRIPERIKALASFLPPFMVEHAKVYSILSLGVHELSEEQCLQHFPVLRGAIELILDDRNAKREREKREREIKAALGKISSTSKDV
jgi:hypothetical protein